MSFTFKTPRGIVTWEDGKLSGTAGLLTELRQEAKRLEKRGETFGAYPTGPWRGKSYFRSAFSAFDFIWIFFHSRSIPVTIKGEVPTPAAPPEGAIQ